MPAVYIPLPVTGDRERVSTIHQSSACASLSLQKLIVRFIGTTVRKKKGKYIHISPGLDTGFSGDKYKTKRKEEENTLRLSVGGTHFDG